MKPIKQSATLITSTPNAIHVIALATSMCYNQTVPKSKDDKVAFVLRNASKHRTLLEHGNATIHFVTDRGITHEFVRHRLISPTQRSTRYCNETGDKSGGEMSYLAPYDENMECDPVLLAMEAAYNAAIAKGVKPQHARDILPTCLRTEMVVTANFREWLYFLHMRLSSAAHPKMRHLAYLCWIELCKACPDIFESLIMDDYHSLLPLHNTYSPESPLSFPISGQVCPLCGSQALQRTGGDIGCLSATCLLHGTFVALPVAVALNTKQAQLTQRAKALRDQLDRLNDGVDQGFATCKPPNNPNVPCGAECITLPGSTSQSCRCGTKGSQGSPSPAGTPTAIITLDEYKYTFLVQEQHAWIDTELRLELSLGSLVSVTSGKETSLCKVVGIESNRVHVAVQ